MRKYYKFEAIILQSWSLMMNRIKQKDIENYLQNVKCVYKTKRGNCFVFSENKKSRIFFEIPNHLNPEKPYRKSIGIEEVLRLSNDTNENQNQVKFYTDCRQKVLENIVRSVLTIKHKESINNNVK